MAPGNDDMPMSAREVSLYRLAQNADFEPFAVGENPGLLARDVKEPGRPWSVGLENSARQRQLPGGKVVGKRKTMHAAVSGRTGLHHLAEPA